MTLPRRQLALLASLLTLAACSTIALRPRATGRRSPDGKQHGLWRYWYASDRLHLKAQGHYKEDRQDGPWTYWYESGQKEWEGEFSNRRLSGISVFWYPNGRLRARGTYAAGNEDGAWIYMTPEEEVDQQGEFVRGKRALRWTHFHPGGRHKADGFRLDGERIGLWRFWGSSGEPFEKRFAIPAGWQVVRESWEDGSARREGMLREGRKSGRWVTWHRNGARRLSGDFEDDRPVGEWTAWRPDGERLAAGPVEAGQPSGKWRVWVQGRPVPRTADAFEPARTAGDGWMDDSAAAGLAPEAVVATWIAELSSPAAPSEVEAPEGAPEPDPALLAETDRRPRAPIRAQPWTSNEEDNLDYLVRRYTQGVKAAPPPSSVYGNRARRAEPKGDRKRSDALLGKPLPSTRFTTGEGTPVDLADHRGKRVVLVILRGYAGMVCVYCTTQTKALQNEQAGFASRNAVVALVYPGPEDGLAAFLEAYKDLSKGVAPSYTQLADPDFRLVDPLGIRGDLAVPTTVILDEAGVVRWAYVGADNADRPSVEELFKALDAMKRG